jgi:hypothetical protein
MSLGQVAALDVGLRPRQSFTIILGRDFSRLMPVSRLFSILQIPRRFGWTIIRGSNPSLFEIREHSLPVIARVAEQVDARDLKSLGATHRTGSIPVPGTIQRSTRSHGVSWAGGLSGRLASNQIPPARHPGSFTAATAVRNRRDFHEFARFS